MQNSQKFISLFQRLEKLATDQSRLPKKADLSNKLSELSKGNNVFRYYKKDLTQLRELRNAIIHGSVKDGSAIAEPHDEIVSKLEEIVKKIESPIKVLPEFQVEIEVVNSLDQISDALDSFYRGDYSQLPVIENGKFIDLLTTDTVTRWIAANKDEGGYLLENVAVHEILPYKEFPDNYKFVSRNTTLIEVLKIFENFKYKQQLIDAILITQDGKKDQKLLGIITHYDIPDILDKI